MHMTQYMVQELEFLSTLKYDEYKFTNVTDFSR